MKLTKELIERIEFALSFVGKTVYASEHNFEGESLSSLIDGIQISEGWGNIDGVKNVEIFLTNTDNDFSNWLNINDFNETWFLTKKELKEYWKNNSSLEEWYLEI